MSIHIDLHSPNGPKVTYPSEAEPEAIQGACPVGWAVDWDTPHVDAGYDSDLDCRRYSAPLVQTTEGTVTDDVLNDLFSALGEHGLKQYEIQECYQGVTVILSEIPPTPPDAQRHPIYKVITDMLRTHGIKGQGKCGGAVETYPLHDGRIFHVVWTGEDSVLLNVAPQGEAW